jgi:hypothetical protein
MWTPGGQPDHLTFAGLRGGGGKGGGGGSSGGQSITSSTTNIPDWLTAASQNAVDRANILSNQPYDPYTGQIVADPTAATQQAYNQVQAMQGMGQPAINASEGAYAGLLGGAQQINPGALINATNPLLNNYMANAYNPAQGNYTGAITNSGNALAGALGQSQGYYGTALGNTQGLLGSYLANQGPATAQEVIGNTQQFMSPYEQAVIGPSMQLGQQALAQNLQQIGAGANQAGAFGGSRQGVQEVVAQAQTSLGESAQIGNLLNQGWQSALPTGYNLANQRAQLGYGAAGLLAGQGMQAAQGLAQQGMSNADLMAQQYYGAAGNLNSMLGQGYGNAAQQAYGAAGQNLQAGLAGAQGMTTDAQTQQQMAQRDASLMQTIGAAQQNQTQQQLNAQMGQFYEQQQYPYQSLDTLLSAIGAVPYGTSTLSYGATQPNAPQRNALASGLGGALSGGATGFMVGGPIGAGVGAVGGGILGALN